MSAVHTLSGVGVLVFSDERYERASYRIELHRHGDYHRKALGSLSLPNSSENRAALMAAFTAGHATLELQSGGSVQIVPNQMNPLDQTASFRFEASGPIPGLGL